MTQVNIGAHMSLGRNPRYTVEEAARDGFGCMQIFASSPGAWKPPAIDEERAADFVLARAQHAIAPLFIHAIYLINLASTDQSLVKRSKASLVATMRAADTLGAVGVVTHIGSHGGRGYSQVAGQIAASLCEVLESTPEQVDLILENSAGAGGIVGSALDELADLMDRAGAETRLRLALDTAHLCAAGWNFQDPGAVDALVSEVEHRLGLERLVLLHVNDSLVPCGARKDRHANIGEGYIGLDGFRHIAADPALRSVPWILETPVQDDEDRHVADLKNLRRLCALLEEPALVDAARGS